MFGDVQGRKIAGGLAAQPKRRAIKLAVRLPSGLHSASVLALVSEPMLGCLGSSVGRAVDS